MDSSEHTRESNYDRFKRDALIRFLTYDQEKLIRRLELASDSTYIYIHFFSRDYRIHRFQPLMEYAGGNGSSTENALIWAEADCNEVMTICDLLCHTDLPIRLSGNVATLEGLNRVKGGNGGVLGDGFYQKKTDFFDRHPAELKKACEELGGVPEGKGDAAYRIPLFGPVFLQISFYQSDDEFPAQLTFFMDEKICDYLFYETLWYMINLVLDRLEVAVNRYRTEVAGCE